MVLKYHQHEALIELVQECQAINNGATEIADSVDAPSTSKKLRELNKVFVTYNRTSSNDREVVRHASEALQVGEESVDLVAMIFVQRNMSFSEAFNTLKNRIKVASARFDKTLWDVAISKEDKQILRGIMNRIGVLMSINEAIPAPIAGRSYDQINTDNNGIIAFSHCFGYTFVSYNRGKAEAGWSVMQRSMEEAIRCAKSVGFNEACRSIACVS
jgi:hypothetical protein